MAPKQGVVKVLKLYKEKGETPLECILRFKKNNPVYEKIKMTYAGRLDPLAEGLLLVLVGDECKNKQKYLNLNKIYELEILFGYSTDSYDLLGLVSDGKNYKEINSKEVFKIIKKNIGKFSQKYPPFSSKTLNGKALFSLARENKIKDFEVPQKEVEIKKIQKIKEYFISKEKLSGEVIKSVLSVKGDFRQKEIISCWKKALTMNKNIKYKVISLRVFCSSGTYMRSLANSIGILMNIPSLAFHIKRIKIGRYKI